MLKVIFFAIAVLTASCLTRNENAIKVKSEYRGSLDSLIVNINHKTAAKIVGVNFGIDTTIHYSAAKSTNGRDVVIYCALYNSGKIVDSFFDFNDLNYVPQSTNIIVTDSLKLRVLFNK